MKSKISEDGLIVGDDFLEYKKNQHPKQLKYQTKYLTIIRLDRVFSESNNTTVFQELSASHLPIDELFKGKNLSVTTYGATGSGKTHTICGSASEPGLTQRFVSDIFRLKSEKYPNHKLACSFIEVANLLTIQLPSKITLTVKKPSKKLDLLSHRNSHKF